MVEPPDVLHVIESALRDAGVLLRARKVYLTLAVLCAVLVAVMIAVANAAGPSIQNQLRAQAFADPVNLCAGIAAFFVMPAVARTVRPEFKLTFAGVLALIGIGFVEGIGTQIGLVLLVLPGIWFFVKISLAPWTYLVSEGKNPFGETWQLTTGHFWETFCLHFLLGILVFLIDLVGLIVPIVIAVLVPITGVVLAPVAFLVIVYVYHVISLAQLRWMLELRKPTRVEEPRAAVAAAI